MFPFSAFTPVEVQPLPRAADVVVIGGGIAGISTAWFLAAQGQSVVVCEKGHVGAEQSGRNWGWIRVQGRDLAEIPLVLEARRHWQDWSQRLGPDLGFRVAGVTYAARNDAEMAEYADWLDKARPFELDTRLLDARQAAEAMPAAGPGTWTGALVTPSDARAEPFVAVPMMAHALRGAGATVLEGCAVRALDLQAGRIAGVVTERGMIRTSAVVLTGGAWSSLFLRRHGVKVPQLSVLSSVAATQPGPAFFAGALADSDFAIRRRADGGYTLAPGSSHRFFIGPDAFRHLGAFRALIKDSWRNTGFRPAAPAGFPDAWSTARHWDAEQPSPFEAMRVLNPEPDHRALEAARKAMARAFPSQAEPRLRTSWAGMIDTMPDVVPVLDHVAALPGLVLGTGLSGHGFGIGPAIGRVLADLVTGRPIGHDLSRFRASRFSDGTRVSPGPAL